MSDPPAGRKDGTTNVKVRFSVHKMLRRIYVETGESYNAMIRRLAAEELRRIEEDSKRGNK